MERPAFTPKIGIVENNTLTALGLQILLQRIIPMGTILVFHTFQEFADNEPDNFFHYFISSQMYIEHTAFFLPRIHKTMILTNGAGNTVSQIEGIHTLNINQEEEELVKDILKMQQHGHRSHGIQPIPTDKAKASALSSREKEVLVLIIKGFINKQRADQLNIGLTTVISHRKNITEKLGIKSVSGLTIYAVMNGYIDADKI